MTRDFYGLEFLILGLLRVRAIKEISLESSSLSHYWKQIPEVCLVWGAGLGRIPNLREVLHIMSIEPITVEPITIEATDHWIRKGRLFLITKSVLKL